MHFRRFVELAAKFNMPLHMRSRIGIAANQVGKSFQVFLIEANRGKQNFFEKTTESLPHLISDYTIGDSLEKYYSAVTSID